MEILDKKSNRMSRANSGVFEHSEEIYSVTNYFLLFIILQQNPFLFEMILFYFFEIFIS